MCLFGFSERLPLALVVRDSNNLNDAMFKICRTYTTQLSPRLFINGTCLKAQRYEYFCVQINPKNPIPHY